MVTPVQDILSRQTHCLRKTRCITVIYGGKEKSLSHGLLRTLPRFYHSKQPAVFNFFQHEEKRAARPHRPLRPYLFRHADDFSSPLTRTACPSPDRPALHLSHSRPPLTSNASLHVPHGSLSLLAGGSGAPSAALILSGKTRRRLVLIV